ncbi:hypothetical protein [Acidithiobacillus sp.]|uniref:hypothetical protein n=1 Tax=Acidithiobacillus sp. TaxID=1872118 RepID=UPI002582CE29|nr:hypothetical protein [Acidithiobacillus sp.]MDD5374441.1 hypothetical protein [Acidithiobacillus sp.]
MTLRETCARLSTSGSLKTVQLIHRPTGEILQELILRPAKEEHRSFLISTWLKSYRPQARRLGFQTQYDIHEPPIAESRWQDCTVATDDDGFTVYAWVCGYPSQLFHVYVVPELRNIGVARALILDACGERPEHARPWPYKNRFVNPYLLKEKYDDHYCTQENS